tara:strand:- start:1446 stop:2387 length:942 start_codon:yes stop_codon:yes gene_type:complete
MKNNNILVVAGEPKSIFLEIFFKAIKLKKYKSPIILICNKNFLTPYIRKMKLKKKIRILELHQLNKNKFNNDCINLINVKLKKNNIKQYIDESFELAFKLINNKFSYKLINGPINKSSFLRKKFLGVTEYVSHKFKVSNPGMLIYNKELSVVPLTTHLPLKMVSKKISKKLLKNKIELVHNFYREHFKFSPKIAVTGLNPHCESILSYNEDNKIISPIISSINKKRINVKGPFPADTIFLKNIRKKYNVIIGMYHDQVLAPIKTLFEFDAINITMGLPFLRITPDHGPNEKMVGKNKSNPISIINALNFLDKN